MVRSPGDSWQIRILEKPVKSKVLFITGFMASGKSAFCRELGALWNLPVLDTDHCIEKATGRSIADIFQLQGEAEFRKMETELIGSIDPDHELIVACGGGLPCYNRNMDLLKSLGTVWWLQTPFEDMYRRITSDQARPLAQRLLHAGGRQLLLQLYLNRQACYQKAHTIIQKKIRALNT